MKKIFSILAAAVIAFSFSSCEKGNSVVMNGFKISVDSITESSAFTHVESADTATYFSVALYAAKALKKYPADTLAAYGLEEIAGYVSYGYTLEELAGYGVVSLGTFEYSWSGLPVNTDIAVIAYQILENESGELSVGKIATLIFRTKDIAVSARKNIEVVDGWFENTIAEDGWYSFGGYTKDSAEYLYFYSDEVESLNDVLDNETFDTQYSTLYVFTAEGYDELSIAKANLRPSYNESTKELTINGTFVASNATEYTLAFKGTEDVESAPVRKAAKKLNTNKEIKLTFGTIK